MRQGPGYYVGAGEAQVEQVSNLPGTRQDRTGTGTQ